MEKIKATKSVSYLQQEFDRITTLAKDMAPTKAKDWFQIRSNILSAFSPSLKPKSATDKIIDSMGDAKEYIEDTFEDAKEAVFGEQEELDALGQAQKVVEEAAAKAKAATKEGVKAAKEGAKATKEKAKKIVSTDDDEEDLSKDEL